MRASLSDRDEAFPAARTLRVRPRSTLAWLAALLLVTFTVAAIALRPAAAEELGLKGVALVIGNGAYEHIAPLPNPENDARAVEAMLNRLGFETTVSTDRDARRLRRDLEGFVEDAGGADVAVIYYSGHGIEAGGENFLVPVDADLAALDSAGERLAPLSGVLAELKATVPVTILLLDACRTNPFPAGATVKLSPDAQAQAVASTGLGVARGAAPLSEATASDSLGQVIGFAAEPGRAALDGEAGGNSPYAAALLRHLGAMQGEEFGVVLRMVTEEVYLKTSGRQRPWVNESLRRLLYFGAAPEAVAGAEGDILAERRRLLVKIAALPDPDRRQIEAIASSDGVPMDALYGMLAALGAEAPKDAAALDQLLRGQTQRLKQMLAEQDALKSEDPDIRRLAGLADQALREGALETAIRLLGDAKARVGELDKSIDATEAALKRKRIEFASVYARSAEARALTSDHSGAAADYAQAFEQVEKWDLKLALDYKISETVALTDHGQYSGDKKALQRAVDAGEMARRLARDLDISAQMRSGIAYGNALQWLGERESGFDALERAEVAYRDALAVVDPDKDWELWADAQNNLANVQATIGQRLGDRQRLESAVEGYRKLLEFSADRADEETLLKAMSNLAKGLHERGELEPGANERLVESRTIYEQALARVKRAQYPMLWAAIQNNHGNVVREIANRTENGPYKVLMLVQALGSFTYATQEWTRERVPAHWAAAQGNMSTIYQDLAWLDASRAVSYLASADAAQSAAMEVMTRDSAPIQWASFLWSRGRTRHSMGDFAATPAEALRHFADAAQDYRNVLTVITRENRPDQWAGVQTLLAVALQAMAARETDTAKALAQLNEALPLQRAAIDFYVGATYAARRAETLHALGTTYIFLADRGGGLEAYRKAEAAYREALSLRPKDKMPEVWAYSQAGTANAMRAIGLILSDRVMLTEARRMTQEAWDTIQIYDQRYESLLAGRIAEIDAALAKPN